MKRVLVWLLLAVVSNEGFAAEKLIILSPHRKSVQKEFVPLFQKYHLKTFGQPVDVEWIDQGGGSDDLKFLIARFAKNPKDPGIDLFWGGGPATFSDLDRRGILSPLELPAKLMKEIPADCSGVPLFNNQHTWYATALATFGVFYNKKIVNMEKLPEIAAWTDLADPRFFGQLQLADPRRSGTANSMNTMVLHSGDWEKGWQTLAEIAANTKQFKHSSSDPIKAVVAGEAAAAMAIDFYVTAKIAELGDGNLGYALPKGQAVLDSDLIGMIKSAPNATIARRFVEFILSQSAQNVLMLPKGFEGGPVFEPLGRMAVNVTSYTATEGKRLTMPNPFGGSMFHKYDFERAVKIMRSFDDLYGAMFVDQHELLKKVWQKILKDGKKPEDIQLLGRVPVDEKELADLEKKWDDPTLRNKTMNEWNAFAASKYKKFLGL